MHRPDLAGVEKSRQEWEFSSYFILATVLWHYFPGSWPRLYSIFRTDKVRMKNLTTETSEHSRFCCYPNANYFYGGIRTVRVGDTLVQSFEWRIVGVDALFRNSDCRISQDWWFRWFDSSTSTMARKSEKAAIETCTFKSHTAVVNDSSSFFSLGQLPGSAVTWPTTRFDWENISSFRLHAYQVKILYLGWSRTVIQIHILIRRRLRISNLFLIPIPRLLRPHLHLGLHNCRTTISRVQEHLALLHGQSYILHPTYGWHNKFSSLSPLLKKKNLFWNSFNTPSQLT
jgi:hypothetical protein